MSRYKYQSYAKDGNGAVIDEATIAVYLAGTTTVASVYAASSGGVAVNSVTSSSTGYYSFWVDDGDYTGEQFFRLKITKSSFSTVTLDDIEILPLMYAGSGTTANRPTVTTVGMYYIDTTLGQLVFWTGSAWTLFTLVSDATPQLGGNLDMNGKNIQTVTPTEMTYLHSVTSAVQTQFNAKAPLANPTFTGEIGIGTVNVSETELGILEGATPTTTEFNYVKNVTSSIQTQFTNTGIKAWVIFDGTGTLDVKDSYNVSSVDDNGIGIYTINFTIPFSSIYYACSGICRYSSNTANVQVRTGVDPTVSALAISTTDHNNVSRDCDFISVICIGSQ